MKLHRKQPEKKSRKVRNNRIRVSDPMAYHARILLGKIIKSYGFEGTVTVKIENTFNKKIPEMESVFLETEGELVPFLVSSCETVDNTLLRLTFDGYDSVEKINEFVGCRVFLTSGKGAVDNENDINQLKGYKISLADNNFLGTITEVIENPGQMLLKIQTAQDIEILVPLHEDLIIKVDSRKKNITMDLPEGLIEVNQ